MPGLGELTGVERGGDEEPVEPVEEHAGDADAHACSRRRVDDEEAKPLLQRGEHELDALAVGDGHDADA